MTVKDLESLYDYGYWANARLFEAAGQLSDDQFTQPVAGSYGSVRNTLVHALNAEWIWLERCGGAPRGPAFTPSDYQTVASLQEQWGRVEGHVRRFLGGLGDDDLDRAVVFATVNGPTQSVRLGDLMHHAAIHGVHHRGQVALLLRSLGVTPGNVDLLVYLNRPRPVVAPTRSAAG